MKILFCTPAPLTKSLGAAKVVVELAEEMRELGWECDLVSIKDLAGKSGLSMSESLRRYLLEHAAEYDVVDYDHEYLPYPRTKFSMKTLFVARSVLLAHHFDVIPIPIGRSWKALASYLLVRKWQHKYQGRKNFRRVYQIIQAADLVNVPNEDDKAELVRRGINSKKIIVIPFGISRSRRPLFDAVSSDVPTKPVVAFVGTFDYRKGAREFPALAQRIVENVADVHFKLMGTAGMFQTAAEVLAHFPAAMRSKIEVIPKYLPEELPNLLASCSIGVFPSYIEGMPFGVLEMLAASVPVVAYNSPGPPMMLTPEYLVSRGDVDAMANKVTELLMNKIKLSQARLWAKEQSQHFQWSKFAKVTSETYTMLSEIKQEQVLSTI